MASALYASRNEPHWGEQKVYMRKNPSAAAAAAAATTTSSSNPNPRPYAASPSAATPQPSPRHRRSPPHNGVGTEDSSSYSHKAPPVPNHHGGRRESVAGGYVTFNVAAYSRAELRDLRRRLVSELERVRGLASWIESRDLYSSTRSAGGSASESYGGGGGNREVTSSAARPAAHRTLPPSDSSFGPRSDGNRPNPNPKADQSSRQQQRLASPLSPVENHKKVSGSKRPPPPVAFPRDPKRPVAVPAGVGAERESVSGSLMKKCGQILTKLMKHKHGWVFNVPVDVVGMGLHDYNQIVKQPMDLGTVKSKLNRNHYDTPLEFAADVRMTFNNALLYNPKGHDVYIMAEQLLRLFEDLFGPANEKYEKHLRAIARGQQREGQKNQFPPADPSSRALPPAPRSLPPPPPAVTAPAKQAVPSSTPRPLPPPQQLLPLPPPLAMVKPVSGKQPKPKAKDPHKREMSFKEKQKLSQDLQSLPDEKMAQVLQIVRRRNPDPAQDGDEIELDFEALDIETLWELDRFVNNCKKMMSKMRRREAISVATAPAPPSATTAPIRTEEKVPVAAMGETPDAAVAGKKTLRRPGGEAGEEDVDIGDEMPSTNFPPVEIEKDNGQGSSSSSDSSSDSDSSSSSSSDSDSRSSSDSDSDADEAQSPAAGLRPPQQPPPRN